MLLATKLCKRYDAGRQPVEAVSDLCIEVASGQMVVIVGRSGSGKSTLLGMIGGLCQPTSGDVLIDGVDPWKLSADARTDFRRRSIGFIFQFSSLLPTLRAIDNVALPALLEGGAHLTSAYAHAADLLDQVGLKDRLDAYPAELSGGEQRRVALARALLPMPPLLLADEPTGDLDEQTEAEVIALLLDACRNQGSTLLLVTHNLALSKRADQVLHMSKGRLLEATTCEQAAETPPPPQRAICPPPPPAPHVIAGPTLGSEQPFISVRVLAWVIAVLLMVLAADFGVGLYQRHLTATRQAVRTQLERAALYRVRADIDRLAYAMDGTCRLTVYVDNVNPQESLELLSPMLRAYIQVGVLWREIPCRSVDGQEGRVLTLSGRQLFDFVFEPHLDEFEELIPGYMHVRFNNAMLIGRQGQGDLVERVDDYYVYLLPRQPDVGKVSRNRFPGAAPLWIPMPPH